jgi:hypothetical protein
LVGKEEMRNKKVETCTYCGKQSSCEDDHVIARQFFPPEQKFRSNLPRVPSCGECNRAKQRVEDIVGVLFQFGHASEASGKVLNQRVARTLAKNKKLAKSLRKGLQKRWIKLPSGIVIQGLAIEMTMEHLRAAKTWFCFIVKGLYRYELKIIFPPLHFLYLIKPSKEQFISFRDIILNTTNHKKRVYANGEFKYIYATNSNEDLSLWIYCFKSIIVVAVTIGPKCPIDIVNKIKKIEWS